MYLLLSLFVSFYSPLSPIAIHFISPSLSSAGGEDDDHRGADLCPLLVALPHVLCGDGGVQVADPLEAHPAGVPGRDVAGHELHHVQPHHLLLPQQQVGTHIHTHTYTQTHERTCTHEYTHLLMHAHTQTTTHALTLENSKL